MPRVSVIMPVYNGEKYIADSIKSVLGQTFKDFELLVVNDCSMDKTLEVIGKFGNKRLTVINNEKNIGSAASRTKAINISRSEYIAILDADDIAYPSRFEKQVDFLDSHPVFGMVATWVKIIDSEGKPTGVLLKDKVAPEKIPATLLFHNIFACSSVMLRKSALPENPFRQETMPIEDIDLWFRMLADGWKFSIINEVLTAYRSHEKGISKVFGDRRQEKMNAIISSQLKKLEILPSDEELAVHRTNFGYGGTDINNFLGKRELWLERLKIQNDKLGIYPKKIFNELIAEKFMVTCSSNAKIGWSAWKLFWQSPLSSRIHRDDKPTEIIKFALKCLLRHN